MRSPLSPLPLLVFGVCANNHDTALTLDDLAFFTHWLDGRSHFHNRYLLNNYLFGYLQENLLSIRRPGAAMNGSALTLNAR